MKRWRIKWFKEDWQHAGLGVFRVRDSWTIYVGPFIADIWRVK